MGTNILKPLENMISENHMYRGKQARNAYIDCSGCQLAHPRLTTKTPEKFAKPQKERIVCQAVELHQRRIFLQQIAFHIQL